MNVSGKQRSNIKLEASNSDDQIINNEMHTEIVIIESVLDWEVSNSGDQYSSLGIICNRCQTLYSIITTGDQ